MLRPTDPYDYTRIDMWFRQAVDPKIFTVNRPPFLGEVNYHEELQNIRYEHRYYYLDGALIGHIAAEIKNGKTLTATVHTLDNPQPKRFSDPTMDVLQTAKAFLLSLLHSKSTRTITSLVPNRSISLSPIIH